MFIQSVRVATIITGLFAATLATSRAQTFELLHSFEADNSAGNQPMATLTEGPDGALYGTASAGGVTGEGTLFKITTDGTFTVLDSFNSATVGKTPRTRLLNLGDGVLYGATYANGVVAGSPSGTVYKFDGSGLAPVFQIPAGLTNPGHGIALASGETDVLQVLCNDKAGAWRVPLGGAARTISFFDAGGTKPRSLIRGSDGYLYGTTEAGGADGLGSIFRLNPDGTNPVVLHECTSTTRATDGIRPLGAMVQAADGTLYGAMSDGGPHNGVIFRLTQAGDYKVLHAFSDLRYPDGDLLLATDGMIYGTAQNGTVSTGGVYRINPNGSGYKTLFQFSNPNTLPNYPQGRAPEGGLVQASDGNLYGTTTSGGANGKGTIFRLKINLPVPIPNRPPVALNDFANITGDTVTVNVKANDFDADGDGLSVRITQDPQNGTLALQPGGAILYTKGSGFSGQDTFKYEVSDGRGGVAPALVVVSDQPKPSFSTPTSLTGILLLNQNLAPGPGVPRAQISVKVLPTGKFSGTLMTHRKRLTIKGTLPPDTLATSVKVKIPTLGNATLFLGLEPSEVGLDVRTVLVSNTENWLGVAFFNLASGATAKQAYTVLLDSDVGNAALPAGHGYGTMKVMPNGAVTVAGKLGDGTALSWSSSLVGVAGILDGVPVFSEPLTGGVCGGFLQRGLNAGDPLQGSVSWVRPANKITTKPYGMGFSGQASVNAQLFTPPASTAAVLGLPSGLISLGGSGPVANAVIGTFALNGKKITATAPLKSLSINRMTGIFTGKILVDKKVLSFTGAVDQPGKSGRGYSSVGGVTTPVVLAP